MAELRETRWIYKAPGKQKAQYYPVQIRTTPEHHFLFTPFVLKDEAAVMRGAKWMGRDGGEKAWRVENCRRNNINLAYLEGKRPFDKYLTIPDLSIIPKTRKNKRGEEISLYGHQIEGAGHIYFHKQCIYAGEMGVGKTLTIFTVIDMVKPDLVWYVAPRSALAGVKLEAMLWNVNANIIYMTYEELKKVLANWKTGDKPPKFIVYDESSRVKTPGSQRSQAAYHLAESLRDMFGDDCYIVEMSGSPAPKSPLDWYWQCEIACPGFIREGDIYKFDKRLSVSEIIEDVTGFKYPKRLAWKDGNPQVCGACGKEPLHITHTERAHSKFHAFMPLPNEVEKLYRRMKGLVLVHFKKDCLDLPEKVYRTVKIKPSMDLIRAARLVTATSKSAITAMTLLRELSDGFQYRDVSAPSDICDFCQGNRVLYQPDGKAEPCSFCGGTGSMSKVERQVVEIPAPKLDALTDLLEENEEIGRLVVFAGFTGSIDRICEHVKKMGWEFIRVDGRGWFNSIDPSWKDTDCLTHFQDNVEGSKKIVFIAHPGTGGMGITLTAASMTVYYSNDFNGESRIQSEDRIHRAGMDVNRGATIVDLILLPTDQQVLDNLKRKRELQSISLGELQQAMTF